MSREFRTETINGKFLISEQSVSRWGNATRELAWQRARSQANPVVFIDLEGNERELGDAFDVAAWERAMYGGHISYQTSMTDGYYAPESFDRWVQFFRQAPSARYNDATAETVAAMDRYLASR